MKKTNLHKYFLITLPVLLFLVLILLCITNPALARPGGGHSYSGGGGSSSGGGDGALVELIFYLLLSLPPEISIPIIIVILIIGYISNRKNKNNPVIASTPTYQNKNTYIQTIEEQLERLKKQDPGFSKVLFLDFATSVFHKFYNLQSTPTFKNLTPFLSDNLINQNNKYLPNKTTEIVIGNIIIEDVEFYADFTAILVRVEANYTVVTNNNARRYIVTERWLYNRKNGTQSLAPQKMQELACPNCGAPANFTDTGVCEHCSTFINKGEMQWFVKDKKIIQQQTFTTDNLLTYTEEVGTNYPTIYQYNINHNTAKIAKKHNIDWSLFYDQFTDKTIIPYFKEIYAAWSVGKWENVRHLVSDRLWENNKFWQDNYKKNGYQNKLENISIQQVDIASIDIDKHYESITVRIFANCFDYVTNNAGKVLAGSNKKLRYFSEYWTFIRHANVEKQPENLNTCPNCSAPADKMGQAGVCEYCGTKVTTGQFSWVLAIITQDEMYEG